MAEKDAGRGWIFRTCPLIPGSIVNIFASKARFGPSQDVDNAFTLGLLMVLGEKLTVPIKQTRVRECQKDRILDSLDKICLRKRFKK